MDLQVIPVVTGAIGGLAYALSGLAAKDKRESFDWKKMLPTIVIAGIVGGIAGFMGQDYGMVADSSIAVGITAVVMKLWSAVSKTGKK